MKYLLLLFFLLFGLTLYGQNKNPKLIGQYRDYFGDRIEIRDDSTFDYSWRFDLMSSWSRGTWTLKNDTIFLKTILVYDTLRHKSETGKIVDSLILADDDTPKLITTPNLSNMLSAGGQNRNPAPNKLLYQNEKLFEIKKNGKLVKRKVRGIWSKKKWIPWYFKQIENN